MTPRSSRKPRMSFRARLGTFIALAVGLTVALAAVVSYVTVRQQLFSQLDGSLRSAWPIDANLSDRDLNSILRAHSGFVQVISPTGGLYASSLSAYGSPQLPPTNSQVEIAGEPGHYRIDTEQYNGVTYRVITQFDGYEGFPAALQVGRPLNEVQHALSTLGLILWFVTLGGVGIAVALGVLIGRETLRPVARLTEAAEHVAATQDLAATIEVPGDDELGRLARAFNAMLEALALSRLQQAQLISDAGHELRTPLTSLRTNVELLMRMPDLPEAERAELQADVEAQLSELTTLIGDLVELARQEELQPEAIEVRLDTLVASAVERARRRAPAGLRFNVHLTPGSVRAQPALLERAVLNILDNAVKWSPPDGVVDVWLQRGSAWTLDVHDQGPGIPAVDLPHVFDRFYRAEEARKLPGSGLGLAIVKQVVTSHGGTVRAYCPPEGGTVVHIELPTVVEVEADAEPAPKAANGALGPGGPGPLPPPGSAAAYPPPGSLEPCSPPGAAGPEGAGMASTP